MSPSRFPASRGIALALFIIAFVPSLIGVARTPPSMKFLPLYLGIAVVALWGLRALNVGSRPFWIAIWIVSILWHAIWTYYGLVGILYGSRFLQEYTILIVIPLWWVATVLILSIGSLVTDWKLQNSAEQDAAVNP